MNIVIIDDGVNSGYYLPTTLVDNYEINDKLKIKRRTTDRGHSHATECAAIINKHENGAQIISIKILDDKLVSIKELTEIMENKEELLNIILLDEKMSGEAIDFLYLKRKRIASITFAFEISNPNIHDMFFCSRIFIWSPLLQRKWLQYLLDKNKDVIFTEDIECPIVRILASDNFDAKFKDIRDYFRDNNYNTISISYKMKGIINGHFFLSENDFNEEILKLLYFEFSCDLMLVQAKENSDNLFDMIINLDDYSNHMVACEEIERHFS